MLLDFLGVIGIGLQVSDFPTMTSKVNEVLYMGLTLVVSRLHLRDYGFAALPITVGSFFKGQLFRMGCAVFLYDVAISRSVSGMWHVGLVGVAFVLRLIILRIVVPPVLLMVCGCLGSNLGYWIQSSGRPSLQACCLWFLIIILLRTR